jgi:hypothetical protein
MQDRLLGAGMSAVAERRGYQGPGAQPLLCVGGQPVTSRLRLSTPARPASIAPHRALLIGALGANHNPWFVCGHIRLPGGWELPQWGSIGAGW